MTPPKQFISPGVIRGYPKAEERKYFQKGRKKGKSMIATGTPENNEIQEKSKEKLETLEKQTRQVIKRKTVEEEEMENEEWNSDGSSTIFELEIDPSSFEELERTVEGDYVLVEFTPANSKSTSEKVYYIAKLLTVRKKSAEFNITFLRKSQKLSGKFIYQMFQTYPP